MNVRLLGGGLLAFLYNHGVGKIPSRTLRKLYLRRWLGNLGVETEIQLNCLFLNGRKVHFGNRNVINFGCLFDGRKYAIRTGDDVSIGPEASILTLAMIRSPQTLPTRAAR